MYTQFTSNIEHCVVCCIFLSEQKSELNFDSVLAPTALLLLPCTNNKHKTIIARPCTPFSRRSARSKAYSIILLD